MKLVNLINKKESNKQTNVRGRFYREQTNDCSNNLKNYLLITKGTGKFYNAYDDDAFIISFLMDYQIVSGIKCGFPDNVLYRVTNKLNECKISYRVMANKNIIIKI